MRRTEAYTNLLMWACVLLVASKSCIHINFNITQIMQTNGLFSDTASALVVVGTLIKAYLRMIKPVLRPVKPGTRHTDSKRRVSLLQVSSMAIGLCMPLHSILTSMGYRKAVLHNVLASKCCIHKTVQAGYAMCFAHCRHDLKVRPTERVLSMQDCPPGSPQPCTQFHTSRCQVRPMSGTPATCLPNTKT